MYTNLLRFHQSLPGNGGKQQETNQTPHIKQTTKLTHSILGTQGKKGATHSSIKQPNIKQIERDLHQRTTEDPKSSDPKIQTFERTRI